MDSAAWNPAQYLKFGGERLRPGYELLARVGDLPPGEAYDLGCGTGEHARAIAARWPDHRISGTGPFRRHAEEGGVSTSAP